MFGNCTYPAILRLTLILLISWLKAGAQLPVARLGVEQGLSNQTVRSIYQDKKGYLWLGTLDGLNRYDGYDFKIYRNQQGDSSSLVGNMVSGITEDNQGYLWLATRNGVCRLNSMRDDFTVVNFQDVTSGRLQKLTGEVVRIVERDAKNNILVATELRGLMICENASLTARQLPLVIDGRISYQYGVQAICFDKTNRTLLFVQGVGLCQLDAIQEQVFILNRDVTYASDLKADGDTVWMATNQGVYTYNCATNRMQPALDVAGGKLSSNLVTSLAPDSSGGLWIGTMGGGVTWFDKRSGRSTFIEAGNRRNQLSGDGIYAVYVDTDSRVWIGTQRAGINLIDRSKESFTTVSYEPGIANSIGGNFVSGISETRDSMLMISTGNGVTVFNQRTHQYKHYPYHSPDKSPAGTYSVNSVYTDHLNRVWVATFSDGVCSFDKSTGVFKRYSTFNPAMGGENTVINILFEDQHQTLWATALRKGNFFGALYRYNRGADRFEIFDSHLSDLMVLTEDADGNLWGGNLSQLVKIDRVSRRHEYYSIGYFVRTITADGDLLWLGTEGGGLVCFDRRKRQVIKRYTSHEGLSNNSIFSAVKDDHGNVWLGTFKGLSKFVKKEARFVNYYRADGLESDQFYFNAAARLRSGAFAFGGLSGYNLFYPDSIGRQRSLPPLHFTNIVADGKPLALQPNFIDTVIAGEVAGITVPYDQAVLTFGFAALEYSVPHKISYAYYLEGWDKGWNYSENRRIASYTHLKEGKYTLRVKSTDASGAWGKEITLAVHVLPPWYRSWWAYTLYILLCAGALYVFFSYRARQTRLRYEVDLHKLNVKTEKAMAEKEREENDRRVSFFTNISHEFRTPLALIINPVKDLLDKQQTDQTNTELQIIYRNAKRMLSLTNQLLLFRKEESGLDAVRPVQMNLVSVCYDVYLCFAQQARNRQITYHFHSDRPEIMMYGDPDKLEIVFYNLLSNAMKYTPPGGTIELRIMDTEELLNVTVSDTGSGIAPEAGDHIFDKFYQAKGGGKPVKPGFGIGLYLARQFVNGHQGSISFTSTAEAGTRFTVALLRGSSHFSENELPVAGTEERGVSILEELTDKDLPEENKAAKYEEVNEETGKLLASEKPSLLLVDDDAAIREYLTLIFKDSYQVYDASTGEAGLTLARKILPDIIISDIMMDELSGIALCAQIKEDPALSHIPVVLLTGTSSDQLRLQGVQGGADDYIMKPFDRELLVARIQNLLKNRNTLQRYFYNEITLSSQQLKVSEQYRQFLEKCIQIVEAHLEDDGFNIKILATEIGMSYSAVTKKIKAISGLSLNSFVRFIRLRTAARLFIDTDYNVTEVATRVGIFDMRYFREQFNKVFGMNPSEYIRKYRKPFANRFTVNKDALDR